VRPDWTRIGESGLLHERAPEAKKIAAAYEALSAGQRLRFRLRANPTRRVNRSHVGTDSKAGKRVELRDEESQRTWLTERKAAQCGFRVLDLQVRPGDALGPKQGGWRRDDEQRRKLTFATVIFDGILEVTDAERFRAALRQGIGPGKAYGFGLLSVAPTEE
jgi:CRISPR system Cascade subunit CasE